MKSPWKFITNLATRHRPQASDKAEEGFEPLSPTADEVDEPFVPARQVESETELGDTPTILRASETDDVLISPVASAVPEAGQLVPNDALAAKTEPMASKASKPASAVDRKPDRAKTRKRSTKTSSSQLIHGLKSELTIEETRSLTEEAKQLDVEIASLRSQLSAKLAAQNQQLRELLNRYENK